MNYEQMIEAKTRLTQIDATYGFWISLAVVIVGILLLAWGEVNRRKIRSGRIFDDHEGPATLGYILGGVVFVIAAGCAIGNVYTYRTAELQARVNMIGYQAHYQTIDHKIEVKDAK